MTLFQILISPMEVLLIPSRANQFQLLVEPLILNVCELLNLPSTLRKFGCKIMQISLKTLQKLCTECFLTFRRIIVRNGFA